MRTEAEILAHFDEWARGNELVRAAVLTGSRADPDGTTDFMSDYDIELYVADLRPFQKDDEWIGVFGPIMVRWPYRPRTTFDEKWLTRLVLFADGVRMDFQITDQLTIDPEAYDHGCKVLLDKDNLTAGLRTPTFSKFIIRRPGWQEYETLVHEFWWNAVYVPKYLWRDELPYAKYMLDHVLRHAFLQKIVEWHIGLQNDWSVSTGLHGRMFKHYLDAETWGQFEATFAGADVETNRLVLFQDC